MTLGDTARMILRHCNNGGADYASVGLEFKPDGEEVLADHEYKYKKRI